jgi:hypothetical protein
LVSLVTHIIYTLLHMRSLCLRTNAGHTGLFSPYPVSAEADEPLIGMVYLERGGCTLRGDWKRVLPLGGLGFV